MKKSSIMTAVLALTLPLAAPASDTSQAAVPEAKAAEQERQISASEKGDKFRARQVKLLEKALKDIGVSEAQRTRIFALQKEHMEKMMTNWQRLKEARSTLSRLQDESAPMEEIDAAIQQVADAQAEQLRLIAHNRREMEEILGKEKYDSFMQNARKQFRRHGRHPGHPLPPRPGADEKPNPPVPPEESRAEAPVAPPEAAPPPP
jgi:uncharacterized protein YjiS (DUF1127 family)